MAKLLNVQSKLEGQGVFVLENATTLKSGANGLRVNGTLDVANLTAGETLTITTDGKEVVNVNADGLHPFQFVTQRRMDSEEVEVGYAVSGVGTADVVLNLEV
ncbi:hypothetical protein U9J35_01610 [Rossellomorea aquimaris]|nr:hypothetical protein [Rossellomorea aquimaris]WRP06893.1 hypothetical protein U9J35_01610 [Rossellomorea aquimaris]